MSSSNGETVARNRKKNACQSAMPPMEPGGHEHDAREEGQGGEQSEGDLGLAGKGRWPMPETP